ncbi:hypothetical protein [Streptomyces phage Vanseggelen]|uniref:Uncharacterized protein n=1 Tax=Streptomyces phage Vanseggelen TaxID=3065246 RepID=A0AA50F171_9CAUD|nr:hypothetical protein [Streptomyces phage Vanseggelen]
MNGEVLEHLARTLEAMPEDQRVALLAALAPPVPVPQPVVGTPRELPPIRVQPVIEWT